MPPRRRRGKSQPRALSVKQHGEAVAIKKHHINAVNHQLDEHQSALARLIDSWTETDQEGNDRLEPSQYGKAKKALAGIAASTGDSLSKELSSGVAAIRELADKHMDQSLSAIGIDDEFSADDEEYDPEEATDAYVTGRKRGALPMLLRTVAAAVLAGDIIDDAADFAEDVFDRLRSRAGLFVHTELSEQYSDRKSSIMDEVADENPWLKKQWQTIDEGCTAVCHPTDEQVQDLEDRFVMGDLSEVEDAPAHPNCCVPGTEIDTPLGRKAIEEIRVGDYVTGGVTGKARRVIRVHVNDHLGSVFKINGQVTVTGNHPVLTSRGWVLAQELEIGDEVFTHSVNPTGSDIDRFTGQPNDRPADAGEEFVPGDIAASFVGGSVPTAGIDFKRNTPSWNGDVDVVDAGRELSLSDNTSVREYGKSLLLQGGNSVMPGNGGGALAFFFRGSTNTANGVMGGGRLTQALGGGHQRSSTDAGFASPSPGNVIGFHGAVDGNPAASEKRGDFQNRKVLHPVESSQLGLVKLKSFHIENIIQSQYSGSVYNLSVELDRSYVADGVVVHNCDCITVPYNDTDRVTVREIDTRSKDRDVIDSDRYG